MLEHRIVSHNAAAARPANHDAGRAVRIHQVIHYRARKRIVVFPDLDPDPVRVGRVTDHLGVPVGANTGICVSVYRIVVNGHRRMLMADDTVAVVVHYVAIRNRAVLEVDSRFIRVAIHRVASDQCVTADGDADTAVAVDPILANACVRPGHG